MAEEFLADPVAHDRDVAVGLEGREVEDRHDPCPVSSSSASGVSSLGLRRPRLSSRSYEYGATRSWQSQRKTTGTGAEMSMARYTAISASGTNSSQGYDAARSSAVLPHSIAADTGSSLVR